MKLGLALLLLVAGYIYFAVVKAATFMLAVFVLSLTVIGMGELVRGLFKSRSGHVAERRVA